MAKDPTIFKNTDFGDVSDDVKKQIQQSQVALFFREREKDLDELRERRLDIQRENREIRDEIIVTYPRDKQAYVKDKKTGKIIPRPKHGPGNRGVRREYRDPGDGNLFGEGKVQPDPEPWMPMDMSRKDKDGKPAQYERGQGKKLMFSDTQPGSSRFVAAYEQKGFKEAWIKNEMEARGYTMDDGPKGFGYTRALSEAQSMWSKQRREWVQKKSDFLLAELREQNKNGRDPASQPAQSADAQATDAQAAQTDAGATAPQSPVVNPAAPAIRMTTVQSADGRVSMSTPGTLDDATAAKWKSLVDDAAKTPGTKMATGPRVGKTGRLVKGGTIFFGSDKGFEDYKKREGIL